MNSIELIIFYIQQLIMVVGENYIRSLLEIRQFTSQRKRIDIIHEYLDEIHCDYNDDDIIIGAMIEADTQNNKLVVDVLMYYYEYKLLFFEYCPLLKLIDNYLSKK